MKNAIVLVVEDDPDLSGNIALILEMEGFRVVLAKSGEEGLAVMQRVCPCLILCDILMPGIDGFAFHRRVKEEPRFAGIPFIFISALNDHHHLRKGMQAGADDYLCKPFSAEELVAAVTARIQRFASLAGGDREIVVSPEQAEALRSVSRRELQILALVASGSKTREIAVRLCISPKTVEVHRSRLMRKLNASNAVMLAQWAKLAEYAVKMNIIGGSAADDDDTANPDEHQEPPGTG